MSSTTQVAILIDCDNISARAASKIMAETAKHGTLSIKRAYGDFTSQQLMGWRKQLPVLAIQPIQQFPYSVGKNSTDSALIVDAMDLLYTTDTDLFYIISSDSDFTRLATRLRESGKRVYGIGARNTPVAFRNACDRFTFLDLLTGEADDAESPDATRAQPKGRQPRTERPKGESQKSGKSKSEKSEKSAGKGDRPRATSPRTASKPAEPAKVTVEEEIDEEPELPPLSELLKSAIRASEQDDGWATLSSVGWYIVNNHPTFDSRDYGYPKLSNLVRNEPGIKVRTRTDDGGRGQLWVTLAESD